MVELLSPQTVGSKDYVGFQIVYMETTQVTSVACELFALYDLALHDLIISPALIRERKLYIMSL